jgi:hypothetical protein
MGGLLEMLGRLQIEDGVRIGNVARLSLRQLHLPI